MKDIVLASNNKHKIKEFREILNNYNILSLEDIGFNEEIEETGTTFEENSKIKAEAILDYLKKNNINAMVVADDSGLCCSSLDGAPGVMSARYADDHNDQANRDKLLKELEGKSREAYYICCITLIDGKDVKQFIGKTEGYILEEETGKKDFCYDCLFYSNDLNKSFGEATEEEKNSVSHRKRAIEKLKKSLVK